MQKQEQALRTTECDIPPPKKNFITSSQESSWVFLILTQTVMCSVSGHSA